MSMGELSRALLVSNGNVTGIVKSLAGDGQLTVTAMVGDRRRSVVQLTEKGRRDFARQAAAHHDWIDGLVRGLPPRDRDDLYMLLGRLRLSLGAATGGKP
jgi:DNA-binding MarR family transcriptional regulator